jgi:hypothetical protein
MMNTDRLFVTAPALVLDEFLTADEAADCLEECIRLKPFFRGATVGQGSQNRIDPGIRQNAVVGLDGLYSGVRENSPLLSHIARRVYSNELNALWHAGYSILDVINYGNYNESILSRYAAGDYYHKHQDTKFNPDTNEELRNRLVTLVYYVNREPEMFTGGELTLYPSDEKPVTITPKHNRAVVFPSFMWHGVSGVTLENDAHENGRFSLNRWMGFR